MTKVQQQKKVRRSNTSALAPRPVSASAQAAPTATQWKIFDAVRDQHGAPWLRVGVERRSIWLSIADLISGERDAFKRLASTGAIMVTRPAQEAFKKAVQAHNQYRPALVASAPGWLENNFVLGDGSVVSPNNADREMIITFELNAKFAPRGELAGWRAAMGPFIVGQPLPYIVVALALTAPLLRFAPPGYVNPQVEIVGDGEIGKTILGCLAASVWCGNESNDAGGAELWDRTVNSVDDSKMQHRDILLVLDEANLAGADPKLRGDFMQTTTFKISTTGTKRRKGDPSAGEHARVALLSTTNTSLTEMLSGSPEVRNAALSRMITVRIASGAPHGIFARVPPGFTTSRAASEELRAAVNRHWGVAGRAFVKRLIAESERDESSLRRRINRLLKLYLSKDDTGIQSSRIQQTFALIATAAFLARRWGIFPKAWGHPRLMIRRVSRQVAGGTVPEASPSAMIEAYAEQHRVGIVDLDETKTERLESLIPAAMGFIRRVGRSREILIPASLFRRHFSNHKRMMQQLRREDRARTEGGARPKLTIKAPRAIAAVGRVYCVRLDGRYALRERSRRP